MVDTFMLLKSWLLPSFVGLPNSASKYTFIRVLTRASDEKRLSRSKCSSKSLLIFPNDFVNRAFTNELTRVDFPEPAWAEDIINIFETDGSSTRILRNAAPIYHENFALSDSSKKTFKKRSTKRVSISKWWIGFG